MACEPGDKTNRTTESAALKRALQRGDFASARKLVASHGAPSEQAQDFPPADDHDAPVSLAQACGTEETDLDGCKLTLIRRTLEDFLSFFPPFHPPPEELAVQRQCAKVLRGARQRFDELEASPALCHAADAGAEDILLLRGETMGPSDPAFFLIGVMFLRSDSLIIEQYFARDERQEMGILKALASRYGASAVVGTFGAPGDRGKKSIPKSLLARCSLHDVDLISDAWEAPQRRTGDDGPVHLDLRKECRDRWGQNKSLESIERALLGRPRNVKLPRRNIAEAYRQFLATGNAARVGDILRHNALDLVTMAAALCQLLTGCDLGDEDA